MNKASASTSLTLVPEIGTFNQFLVCNKGELLQRYQGSPTSPSGISPDFTVNGNQPILSLMVSSSRANGSEIPDEVKFYINNELIGTVTSKSTGYTKTMNTAAAYSTIFELLSPTENSEMYGLRIKGNLVALTGGESGQIKAVFTISEGTSSATLQASCPFLISEVTENSSMVVIEAGDNNNFRITSNTGTGSSVKLVARYYKGLSEITTGVTFKWYRQQFGANSGGGALANWEEIVGATGKELTVSEGDVATSRLYMVHVLDSTGTTVLGQDTQTVYDASDMYEIVMKRSPEDGQVHKAGDSVTVTCEVYRRNNPTPLALPSTAKFSFIGTTTGGTTILSQGPGASPKCTVSYNDIYDAGGQLLLAVEVEF